MSASPQPPFRFGLVGAGNIARLHAAALASLPGVSLRAVLATQRPRAEALAAPHGADAMTDADAFFARPDLDAVSICSPSGTHASLGLQAAAAGKHVLVEKPIDVTLERARALVEGCAARGVKLGVIFQSRFLPAVALIERAIAAGRLGPIYVADAYVKWYREPSYYASTPWRGTRALDGGGALINQAIHTVDLLLRFAGPAANVFAFTGRQRHTGIESEDTAVAVLRYRSGALGVIEATTSVAPGFSRRVELHGARGTIVLDGNDITVWRLDGVGEEEALLERLRQGARDASDGSANPMNLDIDGHRAQIADFVEAVRTGRPPAVDGAEGLKALALVRAIYEAAESGTPVSL